MVQRRAPLIGLISGMVPVTILYYAGYWDPLLAVFTWLSWTVTGWLATRESENRSDSWWNTDIWESRWRLLYVGLVIGGAQFGIHMNLPIPADLTIALWFLVFGIGSAAMLIGMQIAHQRQTVHPTQQH